MKLTRNEMHSLVCVNRWGILTHVDGKTNLYQIYRHMKGKCYSGLFDASKYLVAQGFIYRINPNNKHRTIYALTYKGNYFKEALSEIIEMNNMYKVKAKVTRGKKIGDEIEFEIESKSNLAKTDALTKHMSYSTGIEGLEIISIERVV